MQTILVGLDLLSRGSMLITSNHSGYKVDMYLILYDFYLRSPHWVALQTDEFIFRSAIATCCSHHFSGPTLGCPPPIHADSGSPMLRK